MSGTGARRPRPLVVIPARFSEGATVLRYRAEVNAAKLVASVWAAGGEPLTVHPDAPGAVLDDSLVDAVAERFWMADAILLPGGGDMSARWSGQAAHAVVVRRRRGAGRVRPRTGPAGRCATASRCSGSAAATRS